MAMLVLLRMQEEKDLVQTKYFHMKMTQMTLMMLLIGSVTKWCNGSVGMLEAVIMDLHNGAALPNAPPCH